MEKNRNKTQKNTRQNNFFVKLQADEHKQKLTFCF